MVGGSVHNRFDFISLHGYSLRWQLKRWQLVLDEGTIWLTAKAHETETVSIPTVQEASHLCMQVLRPDGSLCYEKSIKLNDGTDYRQMLTESTLTSPLLPLTSSLLRGDRGGLFLLRTGRPLSVNLDWRRDRYWHPYLMEPTNMKTKKQKGGYHLTCRWQQPEKSKNYIDGDITIATDSRQDGL